MPRRLVYTGCNVHQGDRLAYEIQTKELEPQTVVSVRARCGWSEIGETLGEMLPEVWKYIRRQGVYPTGPPFALYHGFDEDAVDIEGGMPVETTLPGEGRVVSGQIPGGPVASTVHIGPYEKLVEAYDALHIWLREQGKEIAGARWESYLTDPGKVPNPAKWKTELFWPIR